MSDDTFHAARKLSERARSNLYLAACRTFDDACMAAAITGSELFAASLDEMPAEQIDALVATAKVNSAYYYRARDFLNTCEGKPEYVIRF